jgi:hypothetical protein
MDQEPSLVSRLPKFACVERREANVISRLPFSPSNAGIKMKSLLTTSNTW